MPETPISIADKRAKRNAEPDPSTGERLGTRLKKLRGDRDWSLEQLADASGVSRSMLSQIERDQANPTLAVTLRIARALGMSIGELVEAPGATSSVAVIRAGDRAHHFRSDEHCTIRTLSPLHLEKDVEFYEVRLRPKGELRSAAHYEGTREFLTVEKGRVRVTSGSDSDMLNAGDSASYRADVPHLIQNLARSETILFLVNIYRQ